MNREEFIEIYQNHKGSNRQLAKKLGVHIRTVYVWKHKYIAADGKRVLTETSTPTKKPTLKIDDLKPESELFFKPQSKKRYVITSAQNNTEIDYKFFSSLIAYCEYTNSELLVIPTRYKNVTAFIEEGDTHVWWPKELIPYYVNEELELNNGWVVLGDFNISATSSNPLQGIGPIARNKSAIIGHSQIALKMIPTPVWATPRTLITTGSLSKKNYSRSRAGKIAEFNHTNGACVIEVDDNDRCFPRQINALEDGSFCELDYEYFPDGSRKKIDRIDGLVTGDSHVGYMDDGVVSATYTDKDSIVNTLKPKNQYIHDALDFFSKNHHHRNAFLTNVRKSCSEKDDVKAELDQLIETHNKLWSRKDTNYYYIPSNHNDALTRWLEETDPRQDPKNAEIFYSLQLHRIRNPINNVLEDYMKSSEDLLDIKIDNPYKTFFPNRRAKLLLHDIDLNQHGDAGNNGAKASPKSFAMSGYKTVTAHTHVPNITGGAYCVGTSSKLHLDYNGKGYSSWAHCHCIIYPNGKRSLIFIVDGKWRI